MGQRGRGRGRGGGFRGRRRNPQRGNQQQQQNKELPIDLTEDSDELIDDSSSSDDGEYQQQNSLNPTNKAYKSGKQQYYEQNKHRFEMNSEVLEWTLNDIQTPIELDPLIDSFKDVKHYCSSFIDYIFEETRACINQSLQTDSHGDMAKCKVVKWKRGKNKGDSASISFEIIPRQNQQQNIPPYIPIFQKHDYCVVTQEPTLKDLEKQNHFFVIVEQGNQTSTNKFQSQQQPWHRRGGNQSSRRRGKGRNIKGRRGGSNSGGNSRAAVSNISTNFKAKFHASNVTKHMLNMEASKGRKRGQRVSSYNNQNNNRNNNWFVWPIFTMVTKHREYECVQRMAIPDILAPTLTKGVSVVNSTYKQQPVITDNIAPGLRDYLSKNYNESQFRAIEQVMNKPDKIHLIHGPPGTGKTSVLLGLIMSLIADKKRILICSGTNVAVDHIVDKLSKNGLVNSNGEKYQLSINKMARIGNDEKIDELSKKIDPATRFKQLLKIIKEIINVVQLIRKEQFEIMEKSRQSNTAFNAKNSIKSRTEKFVQLMNRTDETIATLLTTKLVNQELVGVMNDKFQKIKEHLNTFLGLGNSVEAKKQDLNNAASAVYEEIDNFYTECQRYLTLDNRDVESKILDNCEIVFATLAITGRHLMRKCRKFDILIIDEAAQVSECESIIPLDLVNDRVVLIGDPQQLPSTVLSQEAISKKYNRSMFERMMKLADTYHKSNNSLLSKPVLLNTQYRMHPMISKFPESEFYHSVLKDGENVIQYNQHPQWKSIYEMGLEPCIFVNCTDSKEHFNGHIKSYENEIEANLIVQLIDMYMNKFGISKSKIAVITFYRAQVDLIRRKLTEYDKKLNESKNPQTTIVSTEQQQIQNNSIDTAVNSNEEKTSKPNNEKVELNSSVKNGSQNEEILTIGEPEVDGDDSDSDSDEDDVILEEEDDWYDVNTVDSYQGSEKQIVILSTVRANDRGSLGFCTDQRRLNVAITRAQFSLVIVGAGDNLCANDLWKRFIENTKVVEPEDIPKLSLGEQQVNSHIKKEDLLMRNLKRNNVNLVSALMNNKFVNNSIRKDAGHIFEFSIEKNNNLILRQLLESCQINWNIKYHNYNNILHRCIYCKSYECINELLQNFRPSLPLLYEMNNFGQLPIHSLVLEYSNKKHPKEQERMKNTFDLMIKSMINFKPNSNQMYNLYLEDTNPISLFYIQDNYGQTVPVIVIMRGHDDLFEILMKYNVIDFNDDDLFELARGGKCEKYFIVDDNTTTVNSNSSTNNNNNIGGASGKQQSAQSNVVNNSQQQVIQQNNYNNTKQKSYNQQQNNYSRPKPQQNQSNNTTNFNRPPQQQKKQTITVNNAPQPNNQNSNNQQHNINKGNKGNNEFKKVNKPPQNTSGNNDGAKVFVKVDKIQSQQKGNSTTDNNNSNSNYYKKNNNNQQKFYKKSTTGSSNYNK
ncbi:hypothetical protein ABK040_005256 [Willaertia magna]